MFGLSFRDKVRNIVNAKLAYTIPSHSFAILAGVCKDAKAKGMNEHDAAIFFIAIMMNSLSDRSDNSEARNFIDSKSRLAFQLAPLASAPHDEIIAFLNVVRSKAELSPLGLRDVGERQQQSDVNQDDELNARFNALFDAMYDDPEEPEDVLKEIFDFLVQLERKKSGFINKAVSGLAGALEGVGGYERLSRLNIDQLDTLVDAAWGSRKGVRQAHEKAAFLLFWCLLHARQQAEWCDDERRELEELGAREDEDNWKMEVKWRLTEESLAALVRRVVELPAY